MARHFRVTIDVAYDEASVGDINNFTLEALLQRAIDSWVGDGILTPNPEWIVDEWKTHVTPFGTGPVSKPATPATGKMDDEERNLIAVLDESVLHVADLARDLLQSVQDIRPQTNLVCFDRGDIERMRRAVDQWTKCSEELVRYYRAKVRA